MCVNDVEVRQERELVCAVQACKNILSVDWKVKDSHGFRKELFQLAAFCRKSDSVAVIYLFMAELHYIAFYSAFFKLWDYVENVHRYTLCNFCEIIAKCYNRRKFTKGTLSSWQINL